MLNECGTLERAHGPRGIGSMASEINTAETPAYFYYIQNYSRDLIAWTIFTPGIIITIITKLFWNMLVERKCCWCKKGKGGSSGPWNGMCLVPHSVLQWASCVSTSFGRWTTFLLRSLSSSWWPASCVRNAEPPRPSGAIWHRNGA